MSIRLIALSFFSLALFSVSSAQKVDYSVVSVPQESGTTFTKVTNDNDNVVMPIVRRTNAGCNWLTNNVLSVTPDGKKIAFVALRNNSTNIFVKDINRQGTSVQRTNRQAVLDFCYSPDSKYICFSEQIGTTNQIFQTDAQSGFVCRQITSGARDYSPIYSSDMSKIFFARQENNGTGIWSFNIQDKFLSNYSSGMNPYPLSDGKSIICARVNTSGNSEIWRVNVDDGTEECIVSSAEHSFTTPVVSPNKKWLLFVGSSLLEAPGIKYYNTDIFVCRMDGTELTQLTYHAADDISPVWSKDGKQIFFISQRGSEDGIANIWKIDFIY